MTGWRVCWLTWRLATGANFSSCYSNLLSMSACICTDGWDRSQFVDAVVMLTAFSALFCCIVLRHLILISANWTEWMAEILFSFDVSLCVCVSVRSGPVNQASLKRLKLPTSNLTCMFSGTVWTWPVENFSKEGVCKNLLGRDMHSHECLLVKSDFYS